MALIAMLFLAACAASEEQQDGGDGPDWPDWSTTATPTPVAASCTNASVTLVAQNLVNGAIGVGENLLWKVTGTNCGKFRLERFGQAPFEFTGSTFFATSYPLPVVGMIEVVSVRPVNASGTALNALTATSAPFNVTTSGSSGGTEPLVCSVGGPYNVDVPTDVYGNWTGAAPIVTMPVTTNRASHLRSMTVVYGNATAYSGIPDYASVGIHNPQVRVNVGGLNLIRFEVSDASNSSVRATCTGSVTVRGVYTAPAQCSLTANRYSASPGQSITFTLSSNGTAYSGTIDGVSVYPYGGQRTLSLSTSRYVQATVTGPGGTTTCQAYINVTRDLVGINYEDWYDYDYNDNTFCMTGYLQVSGKQIISHATQYVTATAKRISACDHSVSVRILDQYGAVQRTINYISSQANGSSWSIYLAPNWTIDSTFTPLGACASTGVAQQQTTGPTSRVAVGNYCNVTGT